MAGTDKKGTTALGLIEASEKLGFSAKGVKGGMSALPRIPTPAIAHVVVKNVLHHYVVIYKVKKASIVVMDPATGLMQNLSFKEFESSWTGVLILLSPDESFQPINRKVSINSRLLFLIYPHRSTLFQSILGAAIFTLIGLTTAIYVQKILDFVLPSWNYNLLNLLAVGMFLLLFVQVLINALKSIFILKTGQQIDAKLILGYYKHLLSLPQKFFDSMRVGEIISRINDAVKIRTFINEVALDIIINIFVILFSFLLLFTYYWKLAAILLLIIPIYAAIFWLSNKFNRKVERQVMEDAAVLESHLVESLNAVQTVKSSGLESYFNLKTEIKFVKLLTSLYKSGLNNIFSASSTFAASRLFTLIVLWYGAILVMDQIITAGELMSFYAVIGYFTGPAGSLIGANRSYQNARIAADRLFEIMDLESPKDGQKLVIGDKEVGNIRFKNILFRYGPRKIVFEDLNVELEKGKITAIVGESGSGKSTLAMLLARLYPVEQGNILIGDYDLSSLSHSTICDIIGFVPQQIDLFEGTILENIALGDFEPNMKRVTELSQKLDMLGFINSQPGGFSCYLGENGVNLSGGQRQRLAILRALYLDPAIVVFDEATSALDVKSEKIVLQTMLELKATGKTVISISHRISSAANADHVILLDKGKVIGAGNHQVLIQEHQLYRSFWQDQGQNTIEDETTS